MCVRQSSTPSRLEIRSDTPATAAGWLVTVRVASPTGSNTRLPKALFRSTTHTFIECRCVDMSGKEEPRGEAPLICCKCNLALAQSKVTATYLGTEFPVELWKCPG